MTSGAFHFHDGTTAETPHELLTVLRSAPLALTSVHIRPDGNDFAAWLHTVHHDDSLAEKVRPCQSPVEVAQVLAEELDRMHEQPRMPRFLRRTKQEDDLPPLPAIEDEPQQPPVQQPQQSPPQMHREEIPPMPQELQRPKEIPPQKHKTLNKTRAIEFFIGLGLGLLAGAALMFLLA